MDPSESVTRIFWQSPCLSSHLNCGSLTSVNVDVVTGCCGIHWLHFHLIFSWGINIAQQRVASFPFAFLFFCFRLRSTTLFCPNISSRVMMPPLDVSNGDDITAAPTGVPDAAAVQGQPPAHIDIANGGDGWYLKAGPKSPWPCKVAVPANDTEWICAMSIIGQADRFHYLATPEEEHVAWVEQFLKYVIHFHACLASPSSNIMILIVWCNYRLGDEQQKLTVDTKITFRHRFVPKVEKVFLVHRVVLSVKSPLFKNIIDEHVSSFHLALFSLRGVQADASSIFLYTDAFVW